MTTTRPHLVDLRPYPYPLSQIPATGTSLDTPDFIDLLDCLLPQSHSLSTVCKVATYGQLDITEELGASLEVLEGQLATAVLLLERWSTDRDAWLAAAQAARVAWIARPVPEDLPRYLEEMAALAASLTGEHRQLMLRLLRTFAEPRGAAEATTPEAPAPEESTV